jgi:hypothetical protein
MRILPRFGPSATLGVNKPMAPSRMEGCAYIIGRVASVNMICINDIHGRLVRLTEERLQHIETDHPEMSSQLNRITETLLEPDSIVRSRTDSEVELFYRYYDATPVTSKFLCIVVKVLINDNFIITAYYTDSIKKGDSLWKKKM